LAVWTWSPLGIPDALFLAFLIELLPILAIVQLPLAGTDPLPRVPVYVASGLTILALGGVAAILGAGSLGWSAMGLTPLSPWRTGVWTGALTASALMLLLVFHIARRALGVRESPLLRQLLPRNDRERWVFVLLSLAAGLGEEIAYRGYALPLLTGMMGPVAAAVLSSGVFGVLHAYQGWIGILRTASLGLLLAGSFFLSGSLWPAVLAHTILDLLGGLVLGDALVRE
jgi:membrane protease YdiL (CAAX protease family)